jgi:hypothetical protein
MQVADAPQRFSWADTDLYRMMVQTFPTLRTKKQKVLDIELLADKIGMTKEGLYKWLRAGRILSKRGAEQLFQFANSDGNREALAELGRTPPTKQDIARFLLS